MYNYLGISFFLLCFGLNLKGQALDKKHVIKGNTYYMSGEYKQAEQEFKKAEFENKRSLKAKCNLGNSLYKQEKYEEAAVAYKQAVSLAKNSEEKNWIYYNKGNNFLKKKEYKGAINSYKQALKSDPEDNNARYNLSLAKKLQEEKSRQEQEQKNLGEQSENSKKPKENQLSQQEKKGKDPKPNQEGSAASKREPGKKMEPEGSLSKKEQKKGERKKTNSFLDATLDAVARQEQEAFRKLMRKKGNKNNLRMKKDW